MRYKVIVINNRNYTIEANLKVERIIRQPRLFDNTTWTIPPGFGIDMGKIVVSTITFIRATVTVEDIVVERKGVIIGIFVIFFR